MLSVVTGREKGVSMTFHEFWEQFLNLSPGAAAICLRLSCAMFLGALIGIEREYTHRPAGLRTHMLVALGACVVSITGEMIFMHYGALGATPDPARLAAQVITGVGFLGAGTIMKEGASVKGLTTAASVWAVACLGITAGFGYYFLALTGTLFTFITLTVLETIQRKLMQNHSTEARYALHTKDVSETLTVVNAAAKAQHVKVSNLYSSRMDAGWEVTFTAHFVGRRNLVYQEKFFSALASADRVETVRRCDEDEKSKIELG